MVLSFIEVSDPVHNIFTHIAKSNIFIFPDPIAYGHPIPIIHDVDVSEFQVHWPLVPHRIYQVPCRAMFCGHIKPMVVFHLRDLKFSPIKIRRNQVGIGICFSVAMADYFRGSAAGY